MTQVKKKNGFDGSSFNEPLRAFYRPKLYTVVVTESPLGADHTRANLLPSIVC
jgi:hypothetical protein